MAPVLGPVFGFGESRGVGVLISLMGLLIAAATVIAAFNRSIRRLELELPDHDAAKPAAAPEIAAGPGLAGSPVEPED